MPTVSAIMTQDPACCLPEESLSKAAQLMLECDCGEIPVIKAKDSKVPVGVVTDRDIVIRCVAQGRNPLEAKVRDCMTSPAVTVTPDTDIEECLQLMEENKIRRIVVVDEKGALTGIVSQADIAAALAPEETGEMVREVSQPGATTAQPGAH